jgi:serine protease Do
MKKLLGIVVLGLLLSSFNFVQANENFEACAINTNTGEEFCFKHNSYKAAIVSAINICGIQTDDKTNCKDIKKVNTSKNYSVVVMHYYGSTRYEAKARSSSKAEQEAILKCKKNDRHISQEPDGCLVWLRGNKKVWKKSVENFEIEKGIITKKPKKKKPKISLDDNKVVPAGSGSGFFVSRNGHIITNHHVIDGCNTTKVSFKGNQLEAKTLAVDKMNDIAILKTNIKPDNIFSISNEDVSLLEDVVVAGYPLGKKVSSAIKTHKGVVTALAGAGDNYSNFQTDATINAGNSGGPIMNQKGNIVGIAVATWVEKDVQGVHFGIKSSTLKTFANANSLKFLPPNNRELSNKDLGKLITQATVYLECHMTVANIKKMIAAANNRKAFFSEFK